MVFGFGVWDFVGLERFESSVGFRVYSVKGLGLQWAARWLEGFNILLVGYRGEPKVNPFFII